MNIISKEAAISRKEYFLKKSNYWLKFDKKVGLHKVVRKVLLNMQEPTKEFLILPQKLEKFFYLYLNKFHPSQQNKQIALNIVRVFSVLSHQYYISAEKFNMKASFFVSPSIWEKWLIGRKARENSIKILEEIGLIFHYRFNRNKHASEGESRFVIMYQFNLQKVKWLYACVKTLSLLGEDHKNENSKYSYDDIMKDVFDEIGKVEEEEEYLF